MNTPEPWNHPGRAPLLVYLIPALLAVLAHGWSLGEPFLAEDFERLVRIHAHPSAPLAWLPSLAEYREMPFFRPLVEISFGLDLWLWGINPLFFHATNVLIFACITSLTGVLAWRLTASTFAGTLSGVLLALSPISVQAVVWVTGRGGMLPLLASLLAMLATLTPRRPKLLVLAPVLLFAAMFAKEWAVALAPTLVVMRIAVLWPEYGPRLFDRLLAGVRSTALVWPSILIYVVVRTVCKGRLVGGYGNESLISPDARGPIEDRLDFIIALLLQVPEAVLAGSPRILLALSLGLFLCWSLRRIARRLPKHLRGLGLICLSWIGAVILIHAPVVVDSPTFADIRHCFPAMPAVCILLAVACCAGPLARWVLSLGLCAVLIPALVQASGEWQLAGKTSERIRKLAPELLASGQFDRLEIHGIPLSLGRAHLGHAIEAMFMPPFYPADARPIETHCDLFITHLGVRRTPTLLSLLAAMREPSARVGLTVYDPASAEIQIVPNPAQRFLVRGTIRTLPDGRPGLECCALPLAFSGVKAPPPGTAVKLRVKVSDVLLVEDILEVGEPILTVVKDQDSSASARIRIVGPPGSFYAVLHSAKPALYPVPGMGLIQVDTSAPAVNGYLNDSGVRHQTFDLHGAELPQVQVVLFTPTGEVHVSRCFCEN